MKIAVTYDEQTGEVFPHFGHTDAFKIYEFGESGLTGAMVLNTSAINGHEAMASFLAKGDVKVLICGGVGEGAMLALSEEGILVVPVKPILRWRSFCRACLRRIIRQIVGRDNFLAAVVEAAAVAVAAIDEKRFSVLYSDKASRPKTDRYGSVQWLHNNVWHNGK